MNRFLGQFFTDIRCTHVLRFFRRIVHPDWSMSSLHATIWVLRSLLSDAIFKVTRSYSAIGQFLQYNITARYVLFIRITVHGIDRCTAENADDISNGLMRAECWICYFTPMEKVKTQKSSNFKQENLQLQLGNAPERLNDPNFMQKLKCPTRCQNLDKDITLL